MIKKLFLGAAFSALSLPAMAATITYEVFLPNDLSPASTTEFRLFAVELDIDTLTVAIQNRTIRFSGFLGFVDTFSILRNGSSRISQSFTDSSAGITGFDFVNSAELNGGPGGGGVTLEIGSEGQIENFSFTLNEADTEFVGNASGCEFFDLFTGDTRDCGVIPFARTTGTLQAPAVTPVPPASTAPPAAVPLPLPGLMLGAGLLGFMGLRRKRVV